jgi:hypothetical protein
VHDEDDAELPTVSPPLPLLMNPHVDMSRQTALSRHSGH